MNIKNPSLLPVEEGYPERFVVTDEQIDWDVPFPEYSPPYYLDPSVAQKVEAGELQPEILRIRPLIQSSMEQEVFYDDAKRPLNPLGRTGIAGRGLLYQWGANKAADPLLCRGYGEDVEVVLVQRAGNRRWAIPGGFVDPNEIPRMAAIRELREETSIDLSKISKGLAAMIIFRGMSFNATRMTDNAWIETTAYYIDSTESAASKIEPQPDMKENIAARWYKATEALEADLHDSHAQYIREVIRLIKAFEKIGVKDIDLVQ